LRKLEQSDLPLIVQYANNQKIADNVLSLPHPYQQKDALDWMASAYQGFEEKQIYVFAIAMQETDAFVGAIGLHLDMTNNKAELGYWIGEPHWNKGIATEAIEAVLQFGFGSLDLQKIYATHFTDSPASGKVMTKNGMIREGNLKDHYKKGTVYKSVIQCRLTKEEYATQKEKNNLH
jgi:RimJ/RimL family protein N-acetyltransferase